MLIEATIAPWKTLSSCASNTHRLSRYSAAVIGGVVAEIELTINQCALPLANIGFAFFRKRLGQRLEQFGGAALVTSTKRNRDREFAGLWQIDFAC